MKKTWLRIISVLEIVGGIFGLIMLLFWFLTSPFNAYSLLLAPIPIAVSIFGLIAGYWLWTGHRFGRISSIIIQIIQIPKIFSSFVIVMFSFGFDLWVQFLVMPNGFTNLGFEFRFLSNNQLFFNVNNAPTGLGISITALIFLVMLINHTPEISAQETETLPQPPSFEQNPVDENSPDKSI